MSLASLGAAVRLDPPPTALLEKQWDELEALEGQLCLQTFKCFVQKAWVIVEPSQPLVWNWHLDVLCAELQALAEGTGDDHVLINVPPGTMKSLLVNVFFRAWLWARNAGLRFLSASYGADLATELNVKLRTIVQSAWYVRNYPRVLLSGDQNAKERFDTTAGGWSIATSVGSVGTGLHPDYIIVDDPTSAKQALGDATRETANLWMDRTISMRGATRGVRVIVIMQRLHEEDLSGHLLARGGWKHICFPMRWDPKRPDPLDKRTKPGELLWPSLFPEHKLRDLERDLGPYGTAGQMQQLPAPEGGGLFRRDWFAIIDAVPTGMKLVRGWDTAGTENGGDWTVGVKLGILNGVFYVLDVVRGQWGPAIVDAVMTHCASLDGKTTAIREEKEGGSAGLAVVAARAKTLVGYDYSGVPVTGDKVTRAKPFRAQAEAGNVRLLRGNWNTVYLDELTAFPVGRHDDQVDATSCAFNAALTEVVYGPVVVKKLKGF